MARAIAQSGVKANKSRSPGRRGATGPADHATGDLADAKPGSAALAHARELRRARPLRTLLARLVGVRTQAHYFAVGARGERKVGRRLNRWAATHGWHVLHAVPAGSHGRDIDHLVIGPFGAVSVNTKTTAHRVWVGQFGMTVGGLTVDYLRSSRAEAAHAAACLTRASGIRVHAAPAIVFYGWRRFTTRRGGPTGVAVLPSPRALRVWLRRRPTVLSQAEMEAIIRPRGSVTRGHLDPGTGKAAP